ncbi:hypothetical protein [Streptomyces atratus]|uniref:hypothetical protein n=1 Tax=Streptomyces atratus TaxID=1893 RepID=UPI0036497802
MSHFIDSGAITPGDEELEDTERTTEELAEIMSSGGVVDVFLCEQLSFKVSIESVSAFVYVPLESHAIAELAAGLPDRRLQLVLPPMDAVLGGIDEVDTAEQALLGRAIAARNQVLGT